MGYETAPFDCFLLSAQRVYNKLLGPPGGFFVWPRVPIEDAGALYRGPGGADAKTESVGDNAGTRIRATIVDASAQAVATDVPPTPLIRHSGLIPTHTAASIRTDQGTFLRNVR